ncbi:MAG: hypothetical protein M1274_11535 [Actinobacteria bacterium]|nr:hypothetical protein [Actinomycetota bacterium]
MVRRELSAEAPGGWILLEILVAVVMLALILGPLTTGMIGILGREVRAERQADIMSSRDLPGEQAWTWGDRAIQAGWR